MSKPLSEAADRAIAAPGAVSVASGGLSAEIDVVESGPVGVVIERLRVTGPTGDLGRRAADLSDAMRPGGTPLAPVEVDPRLGGATLRGPLDRQRRFFEAEVTGDAVELTRKRVGEDGTRQKSDFSLTREALGELLDGIGDAMQPEDDDGVV
jgi:hypothetical protein